MISIRHKNFLPTIFLMPMIFVITLHLFGQLMLAHAADAPSLSDALIQLFGDIKDKAVAAVVIMHVFQILRTHEVFGVLGKIGLQGKGLQVAIAVLTAAGFVADAYAKGGNILQALIEGLFTSGGAMLIFDATKSSIATVASDATMSALAEPGK